MNDLKIDYESYYFACDPFIEAAKAWGCWCLIIVGARNRGKTYSALKYALDRKEQIIFCKRTADDVQLLCAAGKNDDFDDDLSPYADLNDDLGCNIKPHSIYNGVASFNNIIDGKPSFKAGYCFAISMVAKYKGFGGLRKCKYLIFDEFIPAPWERTFTKLEGESVLDLYKTASRDREERGNEPMLLICLANANNLSNQMFNALEITDEVADMAINHEDIRKIGRKLVVLVDDDKLAIAKEQEKTLIYDDMKDTVWGQVTFNNEFARNDLTCVRVRSIKGMKCRCKVLFKNETWFIYQKDGEFYVCDSNSNQYQRDYSLYIESDVKHFYLRDGVAVIDAYYKGKASFQKFRMYDVIIHFKKFFNIQ